jgi:Tfp pilus assembly protein PilZ
MMKKADRRYAKRLAVSTKVKLYRLGRERNHFLDAYLLETKDMTQKGLFFKTQKPLPIGTKLQAEIFLDIDKPPVKADARVAWIAKKSQAGFYPGMGISITDIQKTDRKKIRDFLKNKLRNYRHAQKLKKMYLQLKEMGARLYELEESHKHAEHFRKVIEHAIHQIDDIAHVLDKEVWEVKSL